ncbi:MAG: efflux RND transporter permease subunit [Calditrichia bacterium]
MKRVLLIILLPIWFDYVIFRFVVFFALNVFSKLITLFLVLAAISLKVISLVYKHVLAPGLGFLIKLFDRGMQRVYGIYPQILDWALLNKSKAIFGAVIPFLLVVLVVLPNLGRELIPEVHQGEFNVEITLPVGTPVEKTVETIAPIERFIVKELKNRKSNRSRRLPVSI